MPVPSSYNDITQDANIRDHIGWAWYQRDFFLPKSWKSQQVSIRFGSVNYYAVVVSVHIPCAMNDWNSFLKQHSV